MLQLPSAAERVQTDSVLIIVVTGLLLLPARADLELHSDLHATVTCEMARRGGGGGGLEELRSHRWNGLFTP